VFNDVVYTASVKLPGYRKSEKSQVGKLGIIAHCILGFGIVLKTKTYLQILDSTKPCMLKLTAPCLWKWRSANYKFRR